MLKVILNFAYIACAIEFKIFKIHRLFTCNNNSVFFQVLTFLINAMQKASYYLHWNPTEGITLHEWQETVRKGEEKSLKKNNTTKLSA